MQTRRNAIGRERAPDVAFNTATSVATNTNWQVYSSESRLSYFVPMVVLTVQNFTSAASG
jgi:K+-transporting ATPase ATPase A chain